jgi:hypothetical protein
MSEVSVGTSPPGEDEFAERLDREVQEAKREVYRRYEATATAQATAVLEELSKLRFRADQVVRVLRALQLRVPPPLAALSDLGEAPPEPSLSRTGRAFVGPTRGALEPVELVIDRDVPEVGLEPDEPEVVPEPEIAPGPSPTRSSLSPYRARHFLQSPAPRNMRTEAQVEAFLREMGTGISTPTVTQRWPWANRITIERVLRHFRAKGVLTVAEVGSQVVYQYGGENVYDSWPTSTVGWKRMPGWVGSERGTLATEIAARLEDAVLGVLEERKERLVAREICRELTRRGIDISQDRVSFYLREMENAKVGVVRTGLMRRADDQGAGRTAVEYRALAADGPSRTQAPYRPRGRKVKAAAVEEDVEAKRQRPFQEREATGTEPSLTEESVRDHILANPDRVHTAASITALVGGDVSLAENPIEQSVQILAMLARKGVIKARPTGGYMYQKPTDPGPAARIDQDRKPAADDLPRGGTGPVAGTGKPSKATNKEIAEIIDALRKQGIKCDLAPSGHWAVFAPKGRVMISNTPSNPRTVLNDKARLRRAGVTV